MEDAYQFKNWKNFDDVNLEGYNYGDFTKFDAMGWYRSVSTYQKKYFAVKLKENDRFIGFIGLKKINLMLKKSLLGIVFDAGYVSKSYGFEAMDIFLDYYFNDLKFNQLFLEVNDFNIRAMKLYQKLGFKKIGDRIQYFENQNLFDFDDRYFLEKNGIIYTKITKMVIDKNCR